MRTKLSVIAAIAALVFAGTAKADTISLIWQGGGASTLTSPSSALTADIVITITSTDITSIGWNILWDGDLAYTTTSCTPAFGNWLESCSPFFPAGGSPGMSQGTSPGNQGAYKVNAPAGQFMATGTATFGTITFHVTGGLANDGVDVNSTFAITSDGQGCFATSGYCTGALTLTGAAANVPEPGTVALIGLGLAGLGLVGRRSRS